MEGVLISGLTMDRESMLINGNRIRMEGTDK